MEESPCDRHLRSKNKYPDDEIHTIVLKLLEADPDPNGLNCEWIIDSFLDNQFEIDKDEKTVKEDILTFKNLFGQNKPLPKDYKEMKKMISAKLKKETTKSIVKSRSQTKTSKTDFNDCKSFYKNVKKTLPEPYKDYSKEKSDVLFQMIENANPSGDFQVCIWIVEEIKKGFIKQEELTEVKKYLSQYFKQKKIPLPNFYPNFPIYSNYQLVKDIIDGNVDILFTGDFGILLIPNNTEASCEYGAQTSWCTAQRNKNNKFDVYSKLGNIYIWFDKILNDKFQFQFEGVEFKDRKNEQLPKPKIIEFRNHPILNLIFKEEEQKLLKNRPTSVSNYADKVFGGRWLDAEPHIMKDPKAAASYASKVIKDRWKEAEPYIMKDPVAALLYAQNIIKDRWEQAEPYIMKNPMEAYEYAKNIIGYRWEEAEPYIMKDPYAATPYAIKVLHSKWPDAEPYIMKDGMNAYKYAKNLIRDRWEEAEPYIMENPKAAAVYAVDVIGDRWEEAEPNIMKDSWAAAVYAEDVIGDRWPEAELTIMQLPQASLRYAENVLKGRWPDELTEDGENLREMAEQILMEDEEDWELYEECCM